jgi:aspartate ammonia-lyase
LRTRWFRPKFGEVSVSQGCISDKELREALSEQKRKLGETLVDGGRLTPEQLEEALRHQKAVSAPLGQLLTELGYATEEDIHWALSKMGRKLGEILVEKGIMTKDDIIFLLGQQTGPRRI